MAVQGNRNRNVWQDVKPVQTQPKPSPKKITEGQLFRIAAKLLFKKIKLRFSKPKKRTIISSLLISATIICLGVAYYFIYYKPNLANQIADTGDQTTKPVLVKGTPNYTTIVPTNKKINDLGGWTKISPPGAEPVYTYTDKIGNVEITVSQQPLPEKFKSDPEKEIENLSQEFNANQRITVNNLIVHIGTSADGPQSVIFRVDNLLILIKSDSRIANDQWIQYIKDLN